MKSFIILTLLHLFKGDQIKADKIGDACSTHGKGEKQKTKLPLENLNGRHYFGYLGIYGRTVLQ
jgi:hypothetical protein